MIIVHKSEEEMRADGLVPIEEVDVRTIGAGVPVYLQSHLQATNGKPHRSDHQKWVASWAPRLIEHLHRYLCADSPDTPMPPVGYDALADVLRSKQPADRAEELVGALLLGGPDALQETLDAGKVSLPPPKVVPTSRAPPRGRRRHRWL